MRTRAHRWIIVLAAGDGTQLEPLTARAAEAPVPKQSCALPGRQTMLAETLKRAMRLVPHERIVTIVAAQNREWWEAELQDLPPNNVVVQPQNRGTGAGVLLSLLVVHARDPMAEVLIMPSDHFVGRNDVFDSAAEEALIEAATPGDRIVLLGVAPEEAHYDYGWILPAGTHGPRALRRVEAFAENPDTGTAKELMRRGALINAFLIAARTRSLLKLYRRQPRLLEALRSIVIEGVSNSFESGPLAQLYQSMESFDFSRDLLQPSSSGGLWVLPIPGC